jgi:hypothetical protein
VEYAIAILLLVAVVGLFVTAPLRRDERVEAVRDADLAELEAAKEVKYREIRDAELDYRMGKVSQEDHRATDRELRAQAIEILERIDRLEGREPAER